MPVPEPGWVSSNSRRARAKQRGAGAGLALLAVLEIYRAPKVKLKPAV
jgi:hypothetical protein